jgi:hypothetical protein
MKRTRGRTMDYAALANVTSKKRAGRKEATATLK